METRFFDVVTLREGSIVRVEEYTDATRPWKLPALPA